MRREVRQRATPPATWQHAGGDVNANRNLSPCLRVLSDARLPDSQATRTQSKVHEEPAGVSNVGSTRASNKGVSVYIPQEWRISYPVKQQIRLPRGYRHTSACCHRTPLPDHALRAVSPATPRRRWLPSTGLEVAAGRVVALAGPALAKAWRPGASPRGPRWAARGWAVWPARTPVCAVLLLACRPRPARPASPTKTRRVRRGAQLAQPALPAAYRSVSLAPAPSGRGSNRGALHCAAPFLPGTPIMTSDPRGRDYSLDYSRDR